MTKLTAGILCLVVCLVVCAGAAAQQGGAGPMALTIYNDNFAVVRTTVDLNLAAGANQVTTENVTRQVEPDSVVLRDPTGKTQFTIGEQNYENGVVNQGNLLQKFEGQTIQFTRGWNSDGKDATVSAKVIRGTEQPIVEINGVLEFQLPGTPLFPASADTLLLKPTLRWQIYSVKPARLNAELAYITRGLSWQATYNIVAPDSKDVTGTEQVDVVGWVTIQNHTGTEFPEAKIKLMAGDVAKLSDMTRNNVYALNASAQAIMAAPMPSVTQQAFDDFHLYDLNRTVALRWEETKQVQFLEASGVSMDRVYEYDGAAPTQMRFGYYDQQPGFGLSTNTKVNVRAEIKNSAANHLGMPLPSGRIRLYRRDAGGQMEFIGEGMIQHTPAEQTVKVPVGSAFDVTGERKQTDFHVDQRAHTIDETFEITLKSQKSTPVHVAVVEHMNRGQNWQVTESPLPATVAAPEPGTTGVAVGTAATGPATGGATPTWMKRDSSTIEFPVTVAATGEVKVRYSVRYTW